MKERPTISESLHKTPIMTDSASDSVDDNEHGLAKSPVIKLCAQDSKPSRPDLDPKTASAE
jgi:hypothetical protein